MGHFEWKYNFDNSTYNYQTTADTTMTIYPAMVAIPTPEPEPQKSNNPLEWLRSQVDEICNLAFSS
jgi:hypothetical protein